MRRLSFCGLVMFLGWVVAASACADPIQIDATARGFPYLQHGNWTDDPASLVRGHFVEDWVDPSLLPPLGSYVTININQPVSLELDIRRPGQANVASISLSGRAEGFVRRSEVADDPYFLNGEFAIHFTAADIRIWRTDPALSPSLLALLGHPENFNVSGELDAGWGGGVAVVYSLSVAPNVATPVPEPTVLSLLGAVALGLALRRMLRRATRSDPTSP